MAKGFGSSGSPSRQSASFDTNEATDEKVLTERMGSTSLRIPLSKISYTQKNSKHYNFDAEEIKSMIESKYGSGFDIFEISQNADDYELIDAVVAGEYLDFENQKREVEAVLGMALDYAKFKRGDSDASEPPKVRVMAQGDGKFALLQGNKRTMSQAVLSYTYVESEKPRPQTNLSDLDQLVINAKENETQKKSTFPELIDQVHKELKALSQSLGKPMASIERSEYLKLSGRKLGTISHFYKNVSSEDGLSYLGRFEFLKTLLEFKEFKKLSYDEQIVKVGKFSIDLAEKFSELMGQEISDAAPQAEEKNKIKKVRSISLPKISDVETAKAVVKTLLNSKQYAHLKAELLPNNRLPKTIPELQDIIDSLEVENVIETV